MTTEMERIREWVRLWLAGTPILEIQKALGGARATICEKVRDYLGDDAYQRSKADRYNAGRRRATEASALARARAKGETPRLYHRPRRDGRCANGCGLLVAQSGLDGIPMPPDTGGLCLPCWYKKLTGKELHYSDEAARAIILEAQHGQR